MLEEHGGMSYRAADTKTGVSYGTISNMAAGRVPEMENIVKFAVGFGQDVNEWLRLAGYDPMPDPTPEQAAGVLLDAAATNELTYGGELVGLEIRLADGRLTPEVLELAKRALRPILAEAMERQGRKISEE